eukprot:gene10278-13767_t
MTIAVTFLPRTAPSPLPPVAFIGGGNMASAIIGGLIQQGSPAESFEVVEPFEEARAKLAQSFGIIAKAEAGEALSRCEVVVWAVKPQTFAEATRPVREFADGALQLSVAAGIPSDSIARWLGTERVVRTMPNTPALVGKGMSAIYARPAVAPAERQSVEAILASSWAALCTHRKSPVDARMASTRWRAAGATAG